MPAAADDDEAGLVAGSAMAGAIMAEHTFCSTGEPGSWPARSLVRTVGLVVHVPVAVVLAPALARRLNGCSYAQYSN